MTAASDGVTGVDSDKFRSAVRAYFLNPRRLQGENVSILATGEANDGAEIVIAELQPGSILLGVHVDLTKFATLFDPNDPGTLGKVVAEEIAEPGGATERLEVDWGVGLVDRPEQVEWRML